MFGRLPAVLAPARAEQPTQIGQYPSAWLGPGGLRPLCAGDAQKQPRSKRPPTSVPAVNPVAWLDLTSGLILIS
jgi:hypothetical protein